MIWLLLLQQTYGARAMGSVRIVVHCVYCACKFAYRMERTGFASVSQFGSVSQWKKDEADVRARERLREMLDTEFDCVPCPHCGDYQPPMAERLQKERFKWLLRYQSELMVFGCLALPVFLLFAVGT